MTWHSHAGAACAGDGDVRLLRRLDIPTGPTGLGDDRGARVCTVLDVETTGVDHASDAVIQLAFRRLRYDRDGVITKVDRPFSWLEDPGRPIPPEVVRLTGIRDADVAGRRIDDDAVVHALTHSHFVVAHNAGFDRKWIERRLPATVGLRWCCSMADVDWDRHGFDGRKLGFLGMQCGFFYEAHRAEADVDAVIGLLRHELPDGRTALATMLANAQEPSWFVRAWGAAFEVKDRLRARGYRWDPNRKVWGREVRDRDRLAEEFWLAANIYSAEARPRGGGPAFEPVNWTVRYA